MEEVVLKLRPFACFEDAEIEIREKMAVIGRNRSGKTILTLAFELLKTLAREGFREIILPSGRSIFSLIPFGKEYFKVSVGNYTLTFGYKDFLERFGEEVIRRGKTLEISGEEFDIFQDSILFHTGYVYSKIGERLREFEELVKVANLFKSTYVLRPDNKLMRNYNIVYGEKELKEDGSNIHSFLHNLYVNKMEKFEDIQAYISEIFDIDKLGFDLRDSRIALKVIRNGGEYPAIYESDGFLRTLFYVTAIESLEGLIVIEEPEIHMHLGALEILCEIIKESKNRVLVTTHNPFVLQHFEIDEIYGISDGKIFRFTEEVEVKEFLERERLLLHAV